MAEDSASRVRWACTVCSRREVEFAPSGRCVDCEGSFDVPTVGETSSLRQIGAVASIVGLSLRSVRHYEDAGLVLPAARTAGGFRLYDEQAIGRLRLIMQMKPLGFTLEEMRLLIDARQRLADGDLSPEEAEELVGRVAMFAAAAAEKCAQLREELTIAEAFSADLQREASDFTA
ncbi:MAG: MerR family transcriptional regulator [Acidimicrobiia bacterium]|nr:MerR family transcriptional regulator [Acidimicrobiia bacterium]